MIFFHSYSKIGGLLIAISLACAPAEAATAYLRVQGISVGGAIWVHSGRPRIGFFPATARHIRSHGCKSIDGGAWCRVEYRGTIGWVSKAFVSPDSPPRA